MANNDKICVFIDHTKQHISIKYYRTNDGKEADYEILKTEHVLFGID